MTRSTTPAALPDPADDPRIAEVEAALRDLREPAPAGLADATLVEVGLVDALERFETPIGPVVVAWNGRGVAMLDVAGDLEAVRARHLEATGRPLAEGPAMPARLRRAIERRLGGDRRVRIPLDLRGRAPFEQAVWMKALEIPRGEVRPYGWIAAEIGRPRAVRAVGSALGRNPVPLIVPCHRVVRTDGAIGRYSLGGSAVKRRILEAEGLDVDELERLAAHRVRFIGSDTTGIYCHPTCRNARRIGPSHRVPFHSAGEATGAGYRACRVCRPVAVAA